MSFRLVIGVMGIFRSLKVNSVTSSVARSVGRWGCRSVESFVFVAATGRCGTETLKRLLAAVPRCTAVHEMHPIMHDEVMAAYNEGHIGPMQKQFRMRKLPRIYSAAWGSKWYVETNHMFVKCFSDEVVRAFADRVRVIHLYRDPDSVSASFLLRGDIPGKSPSGDRWLLDSRASGNLIRINDRLESGAFSHPFFRTLWYWYETEARTEAFKHRYPDIPVYDIKTEELNDPQALASLFEWLGMPFSDEVRALVGSKFNASRSKPVLPEDLDASTVRSFHELCREKLQGLKASFA